MHLSCHTVCDLHPGWAHCEIAWEAGAKSAVTMLKKDDSSSMLEAKYNQMQIL